MFLSANAGKRSLGLSLRDPRGREALLRLAGRSDVFLQSLRPGLAEELGLGPDALRAANPRLVYCSVGAYGHVGPLAREAGYDALMQAAGGLISITGEPGRAGCPRRIVAHRPGNRDVGGAGSAGGAARARAHRRRLRGRRVAVRDGDRLRRVPPRRLPRGRDDPDARRDALPDGRALPGVRHAGRRADDRGRQRPAVPSDLHGGRASRARRRSSIPDEPGPCGQPRRACGAARGTAAHSRTRRSGTPD